MFLLLTGCVVFELWTGGDTGSVDESWSTGTVENDSSLGGGTGITPVEVDTSSDTGGTAMEVLGQSVHGRPRLVRGDSELWEGSSHGERMGVVDGLLVAFDGGAHVLTDSPADGDVSLANVSAVLEGDILPRNLRDMDGDGTVDLLLGTTDEHLMGLYLDAWGGELDEPSWSLIEGIEDDEFGLVAALGDLDGDGLSEVAATYRSSWMHKYENYHLWVGTPGKGDDFESGCDASIGGSGWKPYDAVGDFDLDGDGLLDFIVPGSYSATSHFVNVFVQHGVLAPCHSDAVSLQGRFLDAADTNGDGTLELLTGVVNTDTHSYPDWVGWAALYEHDSNLSFWQLNGDEAGDKIGYGGAITVGREGDPRVMVAMPDRDRPAERVGAVLAYGGPFEGSAATSDAIGGWHGSVPDEALGMQVRRMDADGDGHEDLVVWTSGASETLAWFLLGPIL